MIFNTYIPKLSEDQKRLSFLLKRALFFRVLILLGAGFTVLFLCRPLALVFHKPSLAPYIRLIVPYFMLTSISGLMATLFLGLLRIRIMVIVKTILLVLQLLLCYLFFQFGIGLKGVITIFSSVTFVGIIIYFIYGKRYIFKESEPFNMKPCFKYGLNLWASKIVGFGLGKQIDILLLGYFFVAAREIGIYNLAFSLSMLTSSVLIMGMAGVGLAAFSRLEARKGKGPLGKAWQLDMKMAALLSIPILVFALYYIEPLVLLIYSEKYLPAVPILRIFLVSGIVIRLLGGGSHSTVFNAMNKEKIVLWSNCLIGLMNVGLDILLIPRFGILGAAVATAFSGIAVMGMLIFVLKFYIPIKYPFSFLAKVLLSSGAALMAVINVIGNRNIYGIIGSLFLYGFLFVGLLHLLRPLDRRDKELSLQVNGMLYRIACQF